MNSKLNACLLILIVATLAACSGGPSTEEGGGGSSENEGFNESEFYVGVANSTSINSHTRTVGSFSTACSIAPNAVNEDLNCLIDVPEGDLNFNGIELAYNVPETMCRYLVRETYWYYNQEVGYGPSSIQINKTVDNDGAVSVYTCSINGGAAGVCTGLAEIEVDASDSTVKCKYNRTSAGKQNCCLGEYTFTKRTTNVDTGLTTTDTEDLKWGGDITQCIGGAGRTDWEYYSEDGFPRAVNQYAYNGISAKYKVTAPIQGPNDIWSLSVANYSTPGLHTHDGYFDARVSTLPYFIDPVDDRSGTLMPVASPYYRFSCLNEAYEIQNRISVYVREWDVYTDYLAYIASSGVTSVPDRPGETESTDCDGVDGICNDRWDLDDFINELLAAPYDTATPADRRNNFPEQEY